MANHLDKNQLRLLPENRNIKYQNSSPLTKKVYEQRPNRMMLKIAIWILAILSMNTKFQLNDVYIHFEGYVICTMKKVLTSRF